MRDVCIITCRFHLSACNTPCKELDKNFDLHQHIQMMDI